MTIKIVTHAGGFKCNSKLQIFCSLSREDWSWYHLQHFPSAVCRFHWLAQAHVEERNPDSFVRGSCLRFVTDSVAFPERLLGLVPCDVAVSGVGWAANRCTAYHANVEAGNLCPRALGSKQL